ncbi:uncharacterized protein LOC130900327 [Diorhabda carinulata]|uniref:uncharacterized protein LOC130900327 n=1 Tax=Diorhabda carinulata TaxID=1163345 RepID=UPI0025A1DF31|nr:uncharacterized protein LOC130900327 [Diorhabda carinulata]
MCSVSVFLWLLALPNWSNWADGSEFPDRECCDLPSPSPTTVSPPPTDPPVTLKSGPNTKTTVAILNCLLARQFCFEDASCSAILEIIPRVCGPEVVACSTVTVTKCQAALRTLQAFPFFKPTCLCREPHVDPECNSFRDFLFDHPCVFVMKKEKDPYPVDALPTCNHALSVCQQEHKCIKLYEDFKANCKVRDNRCRMDDRDSCYQAWTNLRKSPMFGCICPNNQMKKRCDRIFSMVNHNPCVDSVSDTGTGSSTGTDIGSILGTHASVADVEFDSHLVEGSLVPYVQTSSEIDDETDSTASSDNTSFFASGSSFDDELGIAIVENPLVDAVNGQEAHAGYDHISVSVLKNKERTSTLVRKYPEETEYDQPLDNFIYHQKLPSADDFNEVEKIVFQSTCHTALTSCNNYYHCRMLLNPILHHCDISRCNRNSCMEALQKFYSKPDFHWNVEIAFCLCKKTDNKQDACLIAQEKLHPVCAQRTEESPQPSCLHLAEVCKENKECRSKLEYYEQSCAVDAVTKKCAGSPIECRTAILGILGTDLRTTCACKGTDMTQLYECLGWQRLLWVNPCVVESQKNFHMSKTLEQAKHSTTVPSTSVPLVHHRPTHIHQYNNHNKIFISATETSMHTRLNTIAEFIPPPQAFVPTSTTSTSTITTTTTATTTTTKPTTRRTKPPTTTTTMPPKSCVVQRPQFPNHYIPEGTFKRIYHEDEFECSDVCECEIGEKLTCRTICIDRMPCKTEFAYYNHAAPAFQAFRGRCLCYSGRFICMKPMPNDYSLPQGVFLFLGYSEVDEKELNKNHTVIVVQDIVRVLQNIIEEEAVNGTLCTLEFFNATKENVILSGKLSEDIDYSKLSPPEILAKEKEECVDLLEMVSEKINSKNRDFVSNLLLSIFKMAEVEIIPIETKSSSAIYFFKPHILILSVLLTKIFQYIQSTPS